MGLSVQGISKIISNSTSGNTYNVDKRSVLKPEDYPAIAKLILGGEKQEDIAERFGVSQVRISQIWSEIRDSVYKLYTEEKLLKREVAEKVEEGNNITSNIISLPDLRAKTPKILFHMKQEK